MTVIIALIASVITVGFVVSPAVMAAECAGVKTSILECPGANNSSKNISDNAIWKLLVQALQILAVGVGIAAVGGIVYAAILYASADDRADQTKKAKEIIFNVCYGIAAFLLMYAILNFLIPGGIIQ